MVKGIAFLYLFFGIVSLVMEPALFGKERPPYTFGAWVVKLFFAIPPVYLYLWVIFHS